VGPVDDKGSEKKMKILALQKYKELGLKMEDDNDIPAIVINRMINNDDGRCYLIGREFGDQLKKVKLDIISDYLFEIKKDLYIEFPQDIWVQDINFSGCVFTGNDEWFYLSLFSTQINQVVSLSLSIFPEKEGMSSLKSDSLELSKILDNSICDVSKHNPNIDSLSLSKYKDIFSYAINCILYVQSGQPDLRLIRPPKNKCKSTKGIKKYKRKYPLDIPIVYVGYNYKKHNFYSLDGTTVRGHFRWQPYGKKRSLIKLIWIDTYEKVFNKDQIF